MDRLSPLSAAFLAAEDADPECSLVIGSCAVLEGPAPSVEEVRGLVASRLELAPRYRQRVRTAPLDLRAPAWVDDPDFDLDQHVVARALPRPGSEVELAELVGEVMDARMDRCRPLWEMTVVDGVAGGRWALLCRVHHALADGVSGTELLRLVYDRVEPEHPRHQVGIPKARSGTAQVDEALRAVRGGFALTGALAPVHGPSVMGSLRTGRRYAWRTVEIESVRDLRRSLQVTLNDVALACVAGGFRALLERRGLEPHPRALRSLVPVSAWAGRSAAAPDNRVTLVLADLPVDLESPVRRVVAVHDRMARLRRAGEPQAGLWIQRLAAAVPYALLGRAMRVLLSIPQHQVATVTTNVPGPTVPLACLGRRAEAFLPYVPVADRVRVGVAMFTYCGQLTFGLTGDRDVDDLDVLADGIESSWRELAGTAGSRSGDGSVGGRPRA